MKNIFMPIALAIATYASAQNVSDTLRPVNRASEWSKESALETRKIDSSKLVKKTFTQEIALTKALDILIDMSGELIINTWNDNKIKIETTVQVDPATELTDSEWLEKLGISMKVFGSTVRVKSKANSGFTYIGNGGSGMSNVIVSSYSSTLYGNSFNIQKGSQSVRLSIPAESILEIENKYGHLKIKNNIKSLLLDNTGGEIEFANIEKIQLRSNRGSFSGGIVNDGDIDLAHGRLSLKQLNKGIMTSNYSTIEIESVKDLKLTSANDEIDIDNAVNFYGTKNYGNLRINQLVEKLDITGINSDIKLRHVNPSAKLVKIFNRNADLRLPTSELSNFSVDIKGGYNTVYSPFSEKTTVDTLSTEEKELVKTIINTLSSATTNALSARPSAVTVNGFSSTGTTSSRLPITIQTVATSGQNANLNYSAKIGSGNDPLKYQIICTSCIIDFK